MKQQPKFREDQKVIMTLPNGYTQTYWFKCTHPTNPEVAVCKTKKGGKYHTNVNYTLLKAA